MEGQGQRRVVQYREGKKERRKEGKMRNGDREEGDRDIKNSGRMESRRTVEDGLKVSGRTVWSSELDTNAAAVTSVLISPSAA